MNPVRARHGMVVTDEPVATDVGVAVLQGGGNAVDAAVAVGFALAVTHPFAGNLGGGGFMLVRFADGRSTFIDFRERAPREGFARYVSGRAGEPYARVARRLALGGGAGNACAGSNWRKRSMGTRNGRS